MITLGICALVIIALVIIYAVIMNMSDEGGGEDTTGMQDLADIGTFTVIDENYSLITKLSYTYNGNTLSFYIEDGKWHLQNDEDFPLDQDKLVYMSQAISDYGGYRRLLYSEDKLASYGFDKPLFDITATYYESDGENTYDKHYLFGNKNELTGYYYFWEEGSDYIYMVNDAIFQYFKYVKSQLFVTVKVPSPSLGDIQKITVTDSDGEHDIEIPETAAKADENGNYNYSAAEIIMNTLFTDVKLTYDTHKDYAVGSDKMAEYGLSDPSLRITVDYTEYRTIATEEGTSSAQAAYDATFTVIFGKTDGDTVYVTTEGSDTVYGASLEDYETILNALSKAE